MLTKLWSLLRRVHHDTGGQAMTEAALIMPLYITTVAMTLELCVLATVKSMVDYAAYAGCRAGIVHNADQDYMETAAAMALSPVTQSVLVSLLPWPDKADNITFGTRIGKFAAQAVAAKSQFNSTISAAEYLYSGLKEGVNIDIPSPPTSLDLDKLDQFATDMQIALASPGVLTSLPAINQLQVLDPNTSAVVSQPSDLGSTSSGLFTESGGSETGIDFGAVDSGSNTNLQLRVRVIHQHRLMFPFLKMVYHHILRQGGAQTSDAETMRAKVMGYVEISGDCIMRMQSNLTMKE